MPYLVFISKEDNFMGRLRSHPERAIAGWWGTLGMVLLVTIIVGEREFRGSLEGFNVYLVLGCATVLFASGVLVMLTLFRSADAQAWRLERLGWTLGVAGWATYGIATISYGNSFVSWSLPVAMILLCVIRLISLGETEARHRSLAGA